MKRIISILLVICMLFICSISAFALTDEEQKVDSLIDKTQPAPLQMIEAAEKLGYLSPNATNPIKTYVYQKDGFYYVDVTYTPSYYLTYFHNNPYYALNADSDYISLFADVRIDNMKWTHETGTEGMFQKCINNIHQISFDTSKEYTFTLLSPQKIDNSIPKGPYEDAFEEKDGMYYLDLSKHTLDIKLYIDPFFIKEECRYRFPAAPVSTIKVLAENDDVQLPIPTVQRTVISKKYNTISLCIAPNNIIDGLNSLKHDMYIKLEYTVSNETIAIDIPYSNEYFYTITTDNTQWANIESQDIDIKCAFYDKTSDVISGWYNGKAILQEFPDRATIENWEPGKDDNKPQKIIEDVRQSALINLDDDIKTKNDSDNKCNICKKCPIQPLGICLWLFIGVAICLVAAVIVILVIKKSKSKENQK